MTDLFYCITLAVFALLSFFMPLLVVRAYCSGKFEAGLTVNNLLFVLFLLVAGCVFYQVHLLLAFAILYICGTVAGTVRTRSYRNIVSRTLQHVQCHP